MPDTGLQDQDTSNPVLVEASRGALVECRHRGALAVVDPNGHVVLSAGNIERPVYARSAIKPLQAIPLLESGAADVFGLSNAEIALACASHLGEPRHVDTVRAWLERIGCSTQDLECGTHAPRHVGAQASLAAAGRQAGPEHNNCSGKHAGFLTLAKHLGVATKGYVRIEHPVQQRVLGMLEGMTGLDLGTAPRGIDGCGIPVIGIPLGNLALAMARFADPHDQPEARQTACARICRAMTEEPFMVRGSGGFDTLVMQAAAGRAVLKTGAEGVYCGALLKLGLGIAIKIDDGATRAAEIAMADVLTHFEILGPGNRFAARILHNAAGTEVGGLRPSPGKLV